MSTWIVVCGAAAASFVLRYATVTMADRYALPWWLDRGSAYVAPAAFAGLCAISFAEPATRGLNASAPLWCAAAVTAVVATRRSTQVAMAAGMMTLWAVVALTG